MKRDFLTLKDFSSDELNDMIDLGLKLKKERAESTTHHLLSGKKVALIFEKSSTRTRVSFEVGVYELGGYPLFLSATDIQLGRGETIADTARTLSRYVDGIMIRTFEHTKLEALAANASVPVINGLTDDFHPCQVMADVMTIKEHLGKLKGVRVAFVGDGNNMAHSWLFGAALFGMDFVLSTPAEYPASANIVAEASRLAEKHGGSVTVEQDPMAAVHHADIIYTDVWASMGKEAESEARKAVFMPYQVNDALMNATGKNTLFMHCLPAHRGEEVTESVLESEQSIVFDEAENRLHVQKAIMARLMGGA